MKILFVCLGNTCRSPMAEAILKHLIQKHHLDWEVDSCALRPWNIGRSPTERCLKVLKENGLKSKHIGRMIQPEDFEEFDYILGMDDKIIEELEYLFVKVAPKFPGSKIELLGLYMENSGDSNIADPYFSTSYGDFRLCFKDVNECCENFVASHK